MEERVENSLADGSALFEKSAAGSHSLSRPFVPQANAKKLFHARVGKWEFST